jgi:lipoate-protein ligase A
VTDWPFLLEPAPLKGSVNMAVDEALFRSLAAEPSTWLRFYTWKRPTASLGRGQAAADVVDAAACREKGVDIVRRITGGKLVLHHHELTYSLCSTDTALFSTTVGASYRLISLGLINGLRRLGLDPVLAAATPSFYRRGALPCFAAPAADEIESGGRKLVGSAQRRIGPRFLQHGSIPLRDTTALLKAIARPGAGGPEPEPGDLVDRLGRPVSFEELAGRLAEGLAEFFAVRLVPASLSGSVRAEADALRRERYENDDWTWRGLEPPGLIFKS